MLRIAILDDYQNVAVLASGSSNAGRLQRLSIDVEAAAERGIEVRHTNYDSSPTIELTWALILASARNLIIETACVRSGSELLGTAFAVRRWESLASAVSGAKLGPRPLRYTVV